MSHPIQHIGGGGAITPILSETVWVDADHTVSGWEDETTATTDLYQSANADNDSTWVQLVSWILDTTARIVFRFASPSATPSSVGQDAEIRIKAEYLENFETLPSAPTMTIRFDEGGTQLAASSALSLTTTLAEYSLILSQAEINSVTDWTDIEVDLLFDNTANTGADEEAKFRISRARIIFS